MEYRFNDHVVLPLVDYVEPRIFIRGMSIREQQYRTVPAHGATL